MVLHLHLQVSETDFHFVNFKDLEGIREIYTICGDIICCWPCFRIRCLNKMNQKVFDPSELEIVTSQG